nr:nicotinate-nucleotide pyrophosphorylase [carboxylating] isoform X1 [Ciona intestinalis]|eukprot:XP_002128090.1 nicotinate-nucleotide pyrophosphorylase [carboxylating] isoform X1 [Ciona intestinalis]
MPKPKAVYKSYYEDKYFWVRPSSLGKLFAFCTICNKDFKVSYGGADDVYRHSQRVYHKKLCAQMNDDQTDDNKILPHSHGLRSSARKLTSQNQITLEIHKTEPNGDLVSFPNYPSYSSEHSYILPQAKVASLIKSWLEEDCPSFDYAALAVGEKYNRAELLIKSPGIVSGVPFFDAVFQEVGCEVDWLVSEGMKIDAASLPKTIALIRGEARSILIGERVALNCMARCSGISTLAQSFIEKTRSLEWNGRIAGTRKTTPGFRLAEKYALVVAGADTHRYNLSSMVMLKDNHISSSGNVSSAVERVKFAAGFSVKVEVECQSLEEAIEAVESGAEIIMFDNFTSEELHIAAAALKEMFPNVIIEASGGITEDNLASYCGPHVDVISSSKLVQGYSVVDYSLKIVKE